MKTLIKRFCNNLTKGWRASRQSDYSFGVINLESGTFQQGYITKTGDMKYENPIPTDCWEPPEAIDEIVREQDVICHGLFRKTERWIDEYLSVLYREKHKRNNQYRYFVESPDKRQYIETSAYENLRKIVPINHPNKYKKQVI